MRRAGFVIVVAVSGCSLVVSGDDGNGGLVAGCPDPEPTCQPADECTLALFSFDELPSEPSGEIVDGSVVMDLAHDHDASVIQLGGVGMRPAPDVPHPACGDAIEFPAGSENLVEVPKSPDWDLDTGSVDFWAYIDSGANGQMGLVTRDATGQMTGHFGVVVEGTSELRAELEEPGEDVHGRCFDQRDVPTDTWFHVGVNFGGGEDFELFVDGIRHDSVCLNPSLSGDSTTLGIAGNDNPWAIGADAATSNNGSNANASRFLVSGRIDHVRISNGRREFSLLR